MEEQAIGRTRNWTQCGHFAKVGNEAPCFILCTMHKQILLFATPCTPAHTAPTEARPGSPKMSACKPATTFLTSGLSSKARTPPKSRTCPTHAAYPTSNACHQTLNPSIIQPTTTGTMSLNFLLHFLTVRESLEVLQPLHITNWSGFSTTCFKVCGHRKGVWE